MGERRKLPRSNADHRVTYRKVDREDEDTRHDCTTLNASDGGLCIRIEEELREDETLALEIDADSNKPVINAVARVAWCRSEDDGNAYQAGIEFLWIGSPLMNPAGGLCVNSLWSFF